MLNINKIMGIEEDVVRFMKKEFNKRVDRIKKAEEYYKKPNITDADVDRTYPLLVELLDEQTKIGKEIEQYTGIKIDTDIIINGFKGV